MSFQPTKLEVDPSIIDSNLSFVSNPDDSIFPSSLLPSKSSNMVEELESLIPAPDYPSITATPQPGLCVKAKNEKEEKFFINICKLSEIPAPPPMTEKELERVIAEEDYSNLWRVPMSLGQPRKEVDKSGKSCWAAEVAINSKWFEDIMKDSEVFTGFVVTVAMEGLADKYEKEARLDRQNWLILKNKKAMGDVLPAHRIQQRASVGIQSLGEEDVVKEKRSSIVKSAKTDKKQSSLVTEKPVKNKSSEIQPEFRCVAEPNLINPVRLVLEVDLPGVRGGREVTLDVGEDRLILCSTRLGYLLDVFLPYSLKSEEVSAKFIKKQHKLELIIPVQ